MPFTTHLFNAIWTLLGYALDASFYIKSIMYPTTSEKEVYLVRKLQLGAGTLCEYKVVTPSKDYYLCILPHIVPIEDITFDQQTTQKIFKLSNSIVHCNLCSDLSSAGAESMLDLTNELRKFVLFFGNKSVMMSTFISYVYAIHSANHLKTFNALRVYLNDNDFTELSFPVDDLYKTSFPNFYEMTL